MSPPYVLLRNVNITATQQIAAIYISHDCTVFVRSVRDVVTTILRWKRFVKYYYFSTNIALVDVLYDVRCNNQRYNRAVLRV